jgi:hypothetical protein
VDLAIQALKDIGALQHDGQILLIHYNAVIIAASVANWPIIRPLKSKREIESGAAAAAALSEDF